MPHVNAGVHVIARLLGITATVPSLSHYIFYAFIAFAIINEDTE